MDHCRLCNTEIQSHQVYCPKCGVKYPSLKKEELKEFKNFKTKFKPAFFTAVITLLILFTLFIIKIPVTTTSSYTITETTQKPLTKEIPLGCADQEYEYKVTYTKPRVFADVLNLEYNIKNLEDQEGIFEYTSSIIHKISLEEKHKIGKVTLKPYNNQTVRIDFTEVKSPDQVEISFQLNPPTKNVCETGSEQVYSAEETELTKTEQEKVYKSLFELIFLKE